MQLDHARELKQRALNSVLPNEVARSWRAEALHFGPQGRSIREGQPSPLVAVGIAPSDREDGYRLALRTRGSGPFTERVVERLTALARNEVDLRTTGRVVGAAKGNAPLQGRCMPLMSGASLAHHRFSAGTLGGFARNKPDQDDGAVLLLSNNHVLARLNKQKKGDPTVHPSPDDGGIAPPDTVAGLERCITLNSSGGNKVDAAVAKLSAGIDFDARTLPGLGNLCGVADYSLKGGLVHMVGRTSGVRHGRITAFDVDVLSVGLQSGYYDFVDQIEVEGLGSDSFAQRGDSGALVVDSDHLAVGLLFAVGGVGGSNGRGLSYMNPIQKVLGRLDIRLII